MRRRASAQWNCYLSDQVSSTRSNSHRTANENKIVIIVMAFYEDQQVMVLTHTYRERSVKINSKLNKPLT